MIQTAWAILLGRLTGREDVVFGVTVAGRPPEVAGIENMVGLFINTLLLRSHLVGAYSGLSLEAHDCPIAERLIIRGDTNCFLLPQRDVVEDKVRLRDATIVVPLLGLH